MALATHDARSLAHILGALATGIVRDFFYGNGSGQMCTQCFWLRAHRHHTYVVVGGCLDGYSLSYSQILGIALITGAIFLLYVNHGLERRGLKYAIFATLLPVATISLAKYNFNHGNSWELEQALAFLVTTVMLYAISRRKGEYPLRHFKNPFTIIQALATAAGNVILVFGFNLMTPSVHTAAKRSTAVIAAVSSGKIVFHEKHAAMKAFAMVICVVGVILLVM